ncbi:MAG TPA: extracellular solute-binding protein [Candidatus Eisenbacteria bacterium]|nr:extracellular solute-binding protein [Candidatus Eisenbacteria bacterium]
MGKSKWTRREFVKRAGQTTGAVAVGLSFADFLAACGGGTGTASPATGTGKLEIFSWWTAGGEADGLAEMFKIYQAKYPNVKIVNAAVAGGAGTNAKAVLKTRMESGKPPDSFQVHAGQELISTWVKAGKMEPITSIWKSQNWDSTIPKDLKDIVSSGGDVWSVPVNVHRGNALWYNKKILDANSIAPPVTMDDFFSALSKLKSKVQAPLALGSNGNWEVQMLLENNIVAAGGTDFYKSVMSGKASFTDPNVKQALTWIKQMLSYVNSDHTNLGWDDADKRLIAGTSAFNIMGDWAKGFFTANNWTANVDFGAAPSPGTKGVYMIVCDTFGLPKGAPDRDNAVAWIQVAGSEAGQAAFNPKKGSIPARTDVPASIFDPIAQQFIAEFKTDALVPSSAHGSATPDAFASGVNDEMGQFVLNKDVNKTADNLQKLSDSFLKS